ncbi:MAG TPA: hemerythrin domain-containing protein [Pyrinomonadaceae bacterium]|jgi:hemerythrin-like domain-containing protein
MNLIELLREDHRKCSALISELYHDVKQIEGTELDVIDCERMVTFVKLRDAITRHHDIEKRFFYPALEKFVETQALIRECYREHKEILELVRKMEDLRREKHCDRWDDELVELRHSLRHHFEREEDKLFPKAIRLLGEARMERMLFEIEGALSEQCETGSAVLVAKRPAVGL